MADFESYDIDALLDAVYAKIVTSKKLPKKLRDLIFDKLSSALDIGIDYNFVDDTLATELMTNVYLFSGAKTEVQIREMIGSMFSDGKIVPIGEFKKKAHEVFTNYNENYLIAEYNTALGQSQMVSQWAEIYKNKDVLKYVRYVTAGDGRVSDICKPFDGVTLPFDHPFWRSFSPLNHFNCRCTTISLSEYDDFELTKDKDVNKKTEYGNETVQDVFKTNPFHDQVIFSKKHPYFSEGKNYKKDKNFNVDL